MAKIGEEPRAVYGLRVRKVGTYIRKVQSDGRADGRTRDIPISSFSNLGDGPRAVLLSERTAARAGRIVQPGSPQRRQNRNRTPLSFLAGLLETALERSLLAFDAPSFPPLDYSKRFKDPAI